MIEFEGDSDDIRSRFGSDSDSIRDCDLVSYFLRKDEVHEDLPQESLESKFSLIRRRWAEEEVQVLQDEVLQDHEDLVSD